jgi:hypothetical protein
LKNKTLSIFSTEKRRKKKKKTKVKNKKKTERKSSKLIVIASLARSSTSEPSLWHLAFIGPEHGRA